MSVFIGHGVSRWPEHAPAGVRWMATAPLTGPAVYPPVLDVAESASGTDSVLVETARGVVAPTFRTLGRYGVGEGAAFQLEQRLERADPAMTRYIAESLATALAGLGPRHGLIVRGAHHWDLGSLRFVRRLVVESRASGFNVAFDGPPREFRRRETLRGLDLGAQPVAGDGMADGRRRHELLALCPHGLPLELAQRVLDPAGLPRVTGPGGAPWLYLPRAERRALAATMTAGERHELHRRLFDLWPGRGFGYLRRGHHAIAGHSGELLLRQHASYLAGIAGVSLEFAHSHLAALQHPMLGSRVLSALGSRRPPVRWPSAFRMSAPSTARFATSAGRSRGATIPPTASRPCASCRTRAHSSGRPTGSARPVSGARRPCRSSSGSRMPASATGCRSASRMPWRSSSIARAT